MLMQRKIDAASVAGVGLSRADIVRRCVGAFRKRVVPDPEQWLPKRMYAFPKRGNQVRLISMWLRTCEDFCGGFGKIQRSEKR